MKIDQKLLDDGYVERKKHPVYDYYIYNYTFQAQKECHWNDQIKACRGLILDGSGKVIARPFPKFFNMEEYGFGESKLGKLPPFKSFKAYEKLDGSLGILYRQPNGEYKIATRGSFESEQAVEATKMLHEKHSELLDHLNDDYTYLFEIIYPENRIVVNYDFSDIVLLSAIHKDTGLDMPYNNLKELEDKFLIRLVKKYLFVEDFAKIREQFQYNNSEGFVIQFDHGLRVKLKYEEYVRQHKIVTGLSTRGVWEMLKEGQDFDELLKNVPDEFYKWVEKVKDTLENKYEDTENSCFVIMDIAKKTCATRKDFALEFQKRKDLMGILFTMLDEKDYKQVIWKQLKPDYKQPFKHREEM